MLEIIDQTRNKYLEKYFEDIQHYYKETLKVLGNEDEKDASLIIVGRKRIHNIEILTGKQMLFLLLKLIMMENLVMTHIWVTFL